MLEIRELNTAEFLPELEALLTDTVDSGASIGFLPPLKPEEARSYWADVFAAVATGSKVLSVAIFDGQLVGAVQLGLEARPNGSHRAEVLKLIVHRQARGRGIGRELMLNAEIVARQRERTLLILDTRRGDVAEKLYERLGYQRAGIIPAYARNGSGSLDDTVLMYKQLDH